MKLLVGFVILAGLSFPVQARLGENEPQCIQRYGDELTVTDAGAARSIDYVKGDFVVTVTFMKGVSVCEAYRKNGKDILSDAEVNEIISKNGGSSWSLVEDGSSAKHWAPPGGSADQGASFQTDTLVVWAPGARTALALLKDRNEQQNEMSTKTKAQEATSGL